MSHRDDAKGGHIQFDARTFELIPDSPSIHPGDEVTWIDADGVAALVVTAVEPWSDEDGAAGLSVSFTTAHLDEWTP